MQAVTSVDGFPCKVASAVADDDFFSRARHLGRGAARETHSAPTDPSAARCPRSPGLNMPGLPITRVDLAPGGLSPPYSHPRPAALPAHHRRRRRRRGVRQPVAGRDQAGHAHGVWACAAGDDEGLAAGEVMFFTYMKAQGSRALDLLSEIMLPATLVAEAEKLKSDIFDAGFDM
ncbi:hypothetical protein EJB05_16663, partial [Eragrostis curvula]